MKLSARLKQIARELRDGIPTDLPRQRMDYAARQLEALAALPLPDIESVGDGGGQMLVVHLRRVPTQNERHGLQVLLTGKLQP